MRKSCKICLFIVPLLAFGLLSQTIYAHKNLNVYYRQTISLNGTWNHIVDPYENGYYNYRYEPFDQLDQNGSSGFYADKKMTSPGDLIEYDFDKSPLIHVPGDWNTQDPRYYYYEGTIWYRKKFETPRLSAGERLFLYFGGVNYEAIVYLNGQRIGMHRGGFTPFYFEISGMLKDEMNSLVIKVDNKRHEDAVPTLLTDWWNYGGITRDVKLLIFPDSYIRDYQISLQSVESKAIEGEVYLDGSEKESSVVISIPELDLKTSVRSNQEGIASFKFHPESLEFWSSENPKLYRIEISTPKDKFIDSVGFRTVSVKGNQILLNNQPVFLRGICIHEEYAADGGGRVNESWKALALLTWAKELGCNFVRLAHYPHNEDMVRMAEKMGILVWSEIPVYWNINWKNGSSYLNAQQQLEENMLRDRNRANIIIWSLANETPVSGSRNDFLRKLAEFARSIDNTRLLSAAMEKHYKSVDTAIVDDPLAELVDILSFNEYIGWYDGLPEKCDRITWEIPYDKPVIISEFGGGAKYGYHGEKHVRWTEEFQEELYSKSLRMLDKIDGLCGIAPWILIDFRSPRRSLPVIQDDFNRKGVLSEKGEKKKAFYILQDYYLKKSKATGPVPR